MNGCGEEERGDQAPEPLAGRERTATERRGTSGCGLTRRTSTASPPEKEPQKYRFSERRERHAKIQQEDRPHVDRSNRHEKTRDDRPQRYGQPSPTSGRVILRCHGRGHRNSSRDIVFSEAKPHSRRRG